MDVIQKSQSVAGLPLGSFDDPKLHILYKLPEVCALVRKSRSTILRAVAKGEFVAPIRTGKRSIAWTAASLALWQQECINASKPQ